MPNILRRKILDPILGQLRQGITPEALAASCAVGGVVGMFPLMGTTTAIGLFLAWAFRLNHVALQAVNYLLYPLHLAMIPVFVRIGERLTGSPPVTFSPSDLASTLRADPRAFFAQYGEAGLHAVLAWGVFAVIAFPAAYLPLRFVFRRIRARNQTLHEDDGGA